MAYKWGTPPKGRVRLYVNFLSKKGSLIMVKINGQPKEVGNISIFEYLRNNGYKLEVVAVELNGKIVKKIDYNNTYLHDGDSVEIVSFVGGG